MVNAVPDEVHVAGDLLAVEEVEQHLDDSRLYIPPIQCYTPNGCQDETYIFKTNKRIKFALEHDD